MNPVEEHRQLVSQLSIEEVPGARTTHHSPCGRYFVEETKLIGKGNGERPLQFLRVVARRVCDQAVIDEVLTDHRDLYPGWVSRGTDDYLLFQEMRGGPTVVDLVRGEVASYYDAEDDFIWTDYHLSPSGSRLVVGGCYWACPWDLRVYDFSSPLSVPLPIFAHFEGDDSHLELCHWDGDDFLVTKDKNGERSLAIPQTAHLKWRFPNQ